MNISDDLRSFIIAIAVIAAVALVIEYIAGLAYMARELWYINREIERSDGDELSYWKKCRRRLFLLLVPFAVLFMRNGK